MCCDNKKKQKAQTLFEDFLYAFMYVNGEIRKV